jgi:hypothetical protein
VCQLLRALPCRILLYIHQLSDTFSLDYSIGLVAISVVAYTACSVLTFVSTKSLEEAPANAVVVIAGQTAGNQTTVVQTSSTMGMVR